MTLKEKATLTSPTYLFKFTSDVTETSGVIFLAEELSTELSRYNEILVTETSGTTNFTSGTIELSPTGQWSYEVFEQISTTNRDVNLVDNKTPVETGMLIVKGVETPFSSNSGIDNEFIVNDTDE